jgi:type III secretion protein J
MTQLPRIAKDFLKPFFAPFLLILCMGMMASCQSQTRIVNGLDQNEANEILVFLASKGIDANKVESTEKTGTGAGAKALWDIAVNSEQVTEAMAMLNQAGLPRRQGQNLLGIFSNVGLVPSDLEQKIRYEAGLAETIASTIRKIDGVLDAQVQISFPQEDPLNPGQYKGKITASVYVKHSGVLDDPNSHLISKIKRLVASSITGLDYDNVTVIPDRARYSEQPLGGGTVGEEEKQYVNVWSIILAKDSVTKFRILFFSFTLLILILILLLIWIIWKIHPLLSQRGGFKELFTIHPLQVEHKEEHPEGAEEGKDKASAEPKEPSEEDEKNVDVT